MRGKNDFAGDARGRALEVEALILHAVPNGLQNGKPAVSFIQMQHAWRKPQGPQGAKTTHAEQKFLPDSSAPVSAVEARSKLAVLGGVSFHIRIEQKKIAAAHFDAPHFHADRAAARFDFYGERFALASNVRLHGQLTEIGGQEPLTPPARCEPPAAGL